MDPSNTERRAVYLELLYLELRSEGETEAKEAIPGPEERFELILRKMENVSRGLNQLRDTIRFAF